VSQLPHAYFRKILEKLFCSLDAQDSSAAGDCCGEVSRNNRGSFPVAKSNAGGNRASDRQRLAIKIQLNSLTV